MNRARAYEDHTPSLRRRAVAIYSNVLLRYSETFIADHASSLTRYHPVLMGCRRVEGIDLSTEDVMLINDNSIGGYLREARFKLGHIDERLMESVRAIDPAVVHAHFGGCAAVLLPLMEQCAYPFVVSFHGQDAAPDRKAGLSLTDRLYRRRLSRLHQRADAFLTVTHHMRDVLIKQGFPPQKIRVHPLGIDTDYFSAAPGVTREPVVLFVGRLVEKKGCRFLIDAMEVVQRRHPDVQLVIIGDGPLRASLEQAAARHRVKAAFLGRQPKPIVREWMNRAQVFCVPSIVTESGDREGFGVVFVEAQSMGTPVVSFASGGIPEAVAGGETGILCRERDVAGLAEALSTLLEDASLWDRLSTQAVERVRQEFHASTQAAKLEALYDEVTERYKQRSTTTAPTLA